MALLSAEYASSDEGSPGPHESAQRPSAIAVVAAPDVSSDVWS